MLPEKLDRKMIALAAFFSLGSLAFPGVASLVADGQRKQVEVVTINDYEQATLESLVMSADAIIVGRVTGESAFLLDDRVFTDYRVMAERVIRRAPASRVSVGGDVIVRRPLGSVTVNGNTLASHESGFPPFTTGAVYVLFLARGEARDVYVVSYGPQGAFAVTNGIVRQLSEEFQLWSPERGPVTLDRFLQDIQKIPLRSR